MSAESHNAAVNLFPPMLASRHCSTQALVLNETLWQIAVMEFSPLPLSNRIPYTALPANAVLVLDEATTEPMGAREAGDRVAAV